MKKTIIPIIEKARNTLIGLAHLGVSYLESSDPGTYPDFEVNRKLSRLYFDRARYIESAVQRGKSIEDIENELGQYLDKRENILALKLARYNGQAKTMLNFYDEASIEYNNIQECTKVDITDLEYAQKLVNDYNFILLEKVNKKACEENDRNEAMNKWLADNFVDIRVGDFSSQELEKIMDDYQYRFIGAIHEFINKRKYEIKKSALKALIDREKFLEIGAGNTETLKNSDIFQKVEGNSGEKK